MDSEVTNENFYEKKKELEALFPDKIVRRAIILRENKIIEWDKLFFKWKSPLIREKINSVLPITFLSNFLEGIKYEYGLEGYPVDYEKAYKIYKTNADKSNDLLSMYRMYVIHLRDYTKFRVIRDRILEKYYLFKCLAFSDFGVLQRQTFLMFSIDIYYEAAVHIDEEDQYCINLLKMLKLLKNNPQYNFSSEDLTMIKIVIKTVFDFENKIEKKVLEPLCFIRGNESLFKLAFCAFRLLKDNELAKKFLDMCYQRQYPKAYLSYADFLFTTMGERDKAFEVIKEGTKHDFLCYRYYYGSFLYHFDFSSNEKDKEKILNILDYALVRFLFGDIFYLFEFLYLIKIASRHSNLKEQINIKYKKYIDEIWKYIKGLINRKEECISSFMNSSAYSEILLDIFLLYFYFDNYNKEIDIIEFHKIFSQEVKTITSESIKKFYYWYLYKLRKRLNNPQIISDEKLKKTEKKLLFHYNRGIENYEKKDFSSSILFTMGKIYEKGIGTNQNLSYAYSFYYAAYVKQEIYLPFSPTLLLYRKYKSKKRIKLAKFEGIAKSLTIIQDDNDENCSICFERHKSIAIIPCLHKLCSECYDLINEKGKCPFCRGMILLGQKIESN